MKELENMEFRNESVREIALHFEIPRTTAASWERNIGELEAIKQTLGKNGPDGYLDLIRRREWIPYEREEKENEWVKSLGRWCVDRADDIYLVHESESEDFHDERDTTGSRRRSLGSGWWAVELILQPLEIRDDAHSRGINWSEEMLALQNELERKEEWVKYEMKRVDSEWIGLTRELRQVKKALIEIYQTHLQECRKNLQSKKDKINELKESFPYLRMNNRLVAEATDSSISYVTQFKHTEANGVTNHKPPKHLKRKVRERDDHKCVRCGENDDLEVHHIIPSANGGTHEIENLATLCKPCHKLSHEGNIGDSEVAYDGKGDFWKNWLKES